MVRVKIRQLTPREAVRKALGAATSKIASITVKGNEVVLELKLNQQLTPSELDRILAQLKASWIVEE